MPQESTALPRTVLFFITFAAIGIAVWFLNAYAALFNSFFLAVMIVMTASPIGFWLRNHGVPNWLALLLSVMAALTATALIAGVLAIAVVRMLDIVPDFVASLGGAEDQVAPVLNRLGLTVEDLRTMVSPESVQRVVIRVLQMTLESISMFGLVILIVVFMVIEAFLMPLKLRYSPDFSVMSTDVALGFTLNIRQYIGITTLLGLIGGAILAVVLYFMGVPFAFLWGVLYLVMNYVPMVGFWIALIPPLLLAGQSGGLTAAFIVLGAYMIVSTIINQGVKPAVMRGGLDLSPFWSIMSLIVWSTILGPLGLIVGVPLTIALKELVLATDPQARWAADLLGAGLPPAVEAPEVEVAKQSPVAEDEETAEDKDNNDA
jgi:AI-2 transport protein TqsA